MVMLMRALAAASEEKSSICDVRMFQKDTIQTAARLPFHCSITRDAAADGDAGGLTEVGERKTEP